MRALLLLMGDSGLRRAEAAGARRNGLRIAPATPAIPAAAVHPAGEATSGRPPPVWLLTITGKRNRQRSVPVSAACVAALRAHWADRELDFNAASLPAPLIGPLVIPPTSRARHKHHEPDGQPGQGGYFARGIGVLVKWAMQQLLAGMTELTDAERRQLARTSPHALRHTFGPGGSRQRAVRRDPEGAWAPLAPDHLALRARRTAAHGQRARAVLRATRARGRAAPLAGSA